MRTAERWNPGLVPAIRKIEGPEQVHPYLADLKASVEQGAAPLIVDCLNCAKGCNGGTATLFPERSLGQLEAPVERRSQEMRRRHRKYGPFAAARGRAALRRLVASRWRPGLYDRACVDRSTNDRRRMPTEPELQGIYRSLEKQAQEDFLDCMACGYRSCREMAVAIHNGLNRKENCARYKELQTGAEHARAGGPLFSG
jgi:hypothetical protein